MKVLLFQLDGKIPNIALMRISSHHKALGDSVELRWTGSPQNTLFDRDVERVYASAIFEKTRPVVERLKEEFPDAIVGGTGVSLTETIEARGITTQSQDYSLYPRWRQSIGFSQRGCRLRCSFCVVPRKEGAMRPERTINEIWRGEPWPKEILLLDNDFFGQPNWRDRIAEIKAGGFKVSFNQGINVRFITEESAEAIASIDYRSDDMKTRRIYTAWDNKKDEQRLFAGLELLKKHGVKPRNIMVYMLIGYWPGETDADWVYRQAKLREFGCMPYPMPYVRNRETVGFQRWCIGAYDKRIAWDQWKEAGYQPRNLN